MTTLTSAAMLCDSSLHFRNGPGPLVLSQGLASAGASNKVLKYNYLGIRNCLREPGIDASNPLTSISNSFQY